MKNINAYKEEIASIALEAAESYTAEELTEATRDYGEGSFYQIHIMPIADQIIEENEIEEDDQAALAEEVFEIADDALTAAGYEIC